MVLSSQMGRSGMGRRHMTRRRSTSSWRWRILILAVTAAAVTFWLWPQDTQTPPKSAAMSTGEPNSQTTASVSPTPVNVNTQSHKPVDATHRPDQSTTSLNTDSSPRQDVPHQPPLYNDASPTSTPIALPTEPDAARKSLTNTAMAALPHSPHETAVTTTSGPLALGLRLIEQNQLVEARRVLNDLRLSPNINQNTASTVRQKLAVINETLVFSPRIVPGDTLTEAYTIKNGDLLSSIAPRYNLPYQLIEHINRISARRIRLGQTIKVIKGPFHAVVHKSDYRIDLFLTDSGGQPVYIRSFQVGLGQDNSTPEGNWILRRGGKVANPGWTNPRSGKVYAPNDPQNPIGEYWIGLKGSDENTRDLLGYGIHGTIEPNSVGQQVSMGCVRLRPDDIAMVYKLLTNGQSTVTVRQ